MASRGNAMAPVVINTAIRQRERRANGQSRVMALLFLLVMGGFGLLLALVLAAGNPSAAPTCDGQTMSPTDTCEIFSSNGGGGDYTYQQMIDQRNASHRTWRIVGFVLAGLSVLLVVPVARAFDPAEPWGKQVTDPCPVCGQRNLREKLVTHSRYRGRVTYSYAGIVTLCTPGCTFTAIRRS